MARASIIIIPGVLGRPDLPVLKFYFTEAEWKSFGKPLAFIPSGTLAQGLTLNWADPKAPSARLLSPQNKTSRQCAIRGLDHLGWKPTTPSVSPIDVAVVVRDKAFIQLLPVAYSDFAFKPAGLAPRKVPITRRQPKAATGAPNGSDLNKLRMAVETINQLTPEGAVMEIRDGKLKIMLEL